MSAAVLRELVEEHMNVMPLRVAQYHAMIAGGILPEGEPFELVDGYLVRKNRSATGSDEKTVSPDHTWVVITLAALDAKLKRLGCHIRTQQPVTLSPLSESEPDAAVIAGQLEDYPTGHPTARDTLCIIEVADASLRYDRTIKMRIYAAANIAQYVIVNLIERQIEVYTQPSRSKGRYLQSDIIKPKQRLTLPAVGGRSLRVVASALLPSG